MLVQREVSVALQPIVDVRKRTIFAYEALLRCQNRAFPSPVALIQAALAEGVLGELGQAARALAVKACPSVPLFLNVHPAEFDEGWLIQPDDPTFSHDHDVYLEITESVPIAHLRRCHAMLSEIRDRGIHIVVDDLGSGYSNLKYLADFSPKVVKLDRDLVTGLRKGTRTQVLVRGIVSMCQDLGARVVAEGIETEEELSAVIDAGVHFVQGYLLARPAFPPPAVNWTVL